MISIDQNSHSLWDTLPKLQALHAAGHRVSHFVEDIDVAFTSLGAHVAADDGATLGLARERFHRSGGADWGAALFYSDFLGRQACEIRTFEPYTGLKTNVLAKQLDRTVDELYDEFSPGDNWQLIGPSYVGDRRRHRTIGDLSVRETAPFLMEIIDRARANTLDSFPQADCQARTAQWFDIERQRMEALTEAGPARLVELYVRWLEDYYLWGANICLGQSSSLFGNGSSPCEILNLFTRDYDRAADLYNQALAECPVGLRPIKKAEGELPFFAVYEHDGHRVRGSVMREGADWIRTGDMTFRLDKDGRLPQEEMSKAGISGLAGKAILLVLQVRCGPNGHPLALPHRGSMYMPAAFRLQELLQQHGLLSWPVQPVFRIRFHFLDRLKEIQAVIRLPEHLRGYFGRSEIPASELGHNYNRLAGEAAGRLERFKDAGSRKAWQEEAMPDLSEELRQLDRRRRELAQSAPKGSEVRNIWQDIKLRNIEMLDALVRQVDRDLQVSQIEYWDSRGALLPWAVALGGMSFYNALIKGATIYEQQPSAMPPAAADQPQETHRPSL